MKYLKKYERVISENDTDYYELINKLHELIHAVEVNNINKIKIILSRYKNLINLSDGNDDNPKTPLIKSINNSIRLDNVTKLLIDLGADVNIPDGKDITPLFYAISKGYVNIVELLINAGADVNYIMKNDYAIRSINIYHNSPLLKAIDLYNMWYNDKDKKHDGEYIKIIELLIHAGADLEYKIRDITPLLVSISTKSKEITFLLIEGGANLNAKNKDRVDAFSLLSKLDQKYVIKNYPIQYEKYSLIKKTEKFNL